MSGWTSTADLAAAIDALSVSVPAGFDGDISGTLAWSFAEDVTDTEEDLTDNTDSGSASFNVSVAAGAGEPEAALVVGGENGYFKEDQ